MTDRSVPEGLVEELRAAILRGAADELNGKPNGDIIVKGCEAAEYVDPEDAAAAFVDSIVDEVRPLLEANARELVQASKELDAISAAIGSTRFMDPPDGGDVPVHEQVERMAVALLDAERSRDEALEALRVERKRVAVLEEALRPFGDAANGLAPDLPATDQVLLTVGGLPIAWVYTDQLRRARSVPAQGGERG